MPEYRRRFAPGGQYFFTVVTQDRRKWLTANAARACLRQAFLETRRVAPFAVDAICLMPDHLHCVWTLPEGDSDYPARWSRIKGLFTKKWLSLGDTDRPVGWANTVRARRKGERCVWQERYWEHVIRSERDWGVHVDYIHYNPVKHGLADWPGEWPWSSFSRYLREGFYERIWGASVPESLADFKVPEP